MKLVRIACIYTVVTAFLLGIAYPLAITAIAQLIMKGKANGQMVTRNGETIGSAIIGQPFTGDNYFHSRPSAAGTGYDATASSGSNYGPTNKSLTDRVAASVKTESAGYPIPVDLVTASASGLDPDITPAAAYYQAPRIAQQRHISQDMISALIARQIQPRQLGILGEPRVNVLALNLALSQIPGNAAR
ncbi:potassium-transporting ATPase subunit KdpC [Terriglobus sp. RCC_193]|uniref:potassium-transporting ATPase subunit KdpC n=1 Tax=Terriglobus sp. RCC_193 TaxID=3239218 RepID=UPI0035269510